MKGNINENVDEDFKIYDINEVEDLHAYNFYKKIDTWYVKGCKNMRCNRCVRLIEIHSVNQNSKIIKYT